MKVVLFGNSTWCLTNFRAGLIQRLVDSGADVTVLAPLDPTYDNEKLVPLIRSYGAKFLEVPMQPRNKNPLRELYSIFAIGRALKKLDPDVILTFTIKCNLYTGLCRPFLRAKQIANIPGLGEVFSRKDIVYRIVCLLYRLAFKEMSAALFQNKEDLNFCAKNRLIKKEICELIPGSGVDTEYFAPSYPRSSDTPVTFLIFGRMLPQKGYYEFLDVARFFEQKFPGRARFEILGIQDLNRIESRRLYAQVKEAASEGVVRYHTSLVDVRPVLSRADVVCLPSMYNEGIPRSLLEAMSSGKAIITTNWKGCRETVLEGQNGYLIQPGSFEALKDAVTRMLGLSHSELRAFGEKSREIVLERFDERLVLNAYLRHLSALGFEVSEIPLSTTIDREALVVRKSAIRSDVDETSEIPVSDIISLDSPIDDEIRKAS